MIAGIVAGRLLPAPWWLFALIGAVALGGLVRSLVRPGSMVIALPVALLCFSIGATQMSRIEHPELPGNHVLLYADKPAINCIARVAEPPEVFDDHLTVTVEAQNVVEQKGVHVPVQGRMQLRIPLKPPVAEHEMLHTGDRIKFHSALRRVRSFGMPGVFDRKTFLHRRAIFVTAYTRKMPEVLAQAKAGFFERTRNRVRNFLRDRMKQPESGILIALVLGEKNFLSLQTLATYKKGGVAHLLAISGMHLGALFALTYFLTTAILRRFPRFLRHFHLQKTAVVPALAATFFYGALSGWQISTARSFLMVAVFAVSLLIGRHRDFLSVYAMAALAILLIWPYALFETGFQLSFAAVGAIAYLYYSPLRSLIRRRDEIDRLKEPSIGATVIDVIKALALSTVAAGLATAPITAYHFGSVQPYSLLGNLIMVPVYTLFAVPVSLTGTTLFLVSPELARLLFWGCGEVIAGALHIVHLIAALPGSSVAVPRPGVVEIIAFFGLVLAMPYLPRKRPALVAGCCALVLLALPISARIADRQTDSLRVTVLDVGQGLSQLIEFPGGERWLVDGGGTYGDGFDIGEQVTLPFLRGKGVTHLDRVISTHPHPDHLDGLLPVLENLSVDRIVYSGLDDFGPGSKERFEAVLERFPGDRRLLGTSELGSETIAGVTVQWLYPPREAYNSDGPFADWSANDRSSVIRLSFGNCSILLAADIEKPAERYLVELNAPIQSTALVAPHHGSVTSSTPSFVKVTEARVVVFSAGEYNPFRHPSPIVLERFTRSGAEVFRTDRDGAVELICGKEGFAVVAPYKKTSLTNF